jgi:3-oxoacyl-[acyl-carrier protein] reductase
MNLGLAGKTALVTGASEGIGAGIAHALSAEGVTVAICARTRDKLEQTAARISAETGGRVLPIVADLGTLEGCNSFVAQAHAQLGRIDILVNNAGSAKMAAFVDMPDEMFIDAFNGKLFAAMRCARAVIEPMKAGGGGVILNITGATQQGVLLFSAGGSCNAAVRMFSKVLSLELAPLGIRVNSIAPGRIKTTRLVATFAAEAAASGSTPDMIEAKNVASIPSGRLGEPLDIANLVCFLASDLSAYINGAAISVDGGKSPLM